MRFFELTPPRYATDAEADRRNPVRPLVDWHVPSITCDECGRWASSDRLRMQLPLARDLEAFGQISFLPAHEWLRRRSEWAQLLGVLPERINPGAELGPPRAEVENRDLEDFVHPSPGQIWVGERAMPALAHAEFAGVDFVEVETSWMKGEGSSRQRPRLWELVVSGSAWRKGSNEQSITACARCGRTTFPNASRLEVDEARWGGSDFFHLDRNPNIIVVTERVRDLLEANRFSNFRCVSTAPSNTGEQVPDEMIARGGDPA